MHRNARKTERTNPTPLNAVPPPPPEQLAEPALELPPVVAVDRAVILELMNLGLQIQVADLMRERAINHAAAGRASCAERIVLHAGLTLPASQLFEVYDVDAQGARLVLRPTPTQG